MDDKLVGNWLGSMFLPDSSRVDHTLSLLADGTFWWEAVGPDGIAASWAGSWLPPGGKGTMLLETATTNPGSMAGTALGFPGPDDTNTLLIERLSDSGKRDLAVLFFRVRGRD